MIEENKFNIGNKYKAFNIKDQELVYYIVINHGNNKVTFKERHISDINQNNEYEKINEYDIDIKFGIETVLVFNFYNHEIYLYANENIN